MHSQLRLDPAWRAPGDDRVFAKCITMRHGAHLAHAVGEGVTSPLQAVEWVNEFFAGQTSIRWSDRAHGWTGSVGMEEGDAAARARACIHGANLLPVRPADGQPPRCARAAVV